MKELIKRLRTHAEYADVITPIAEDMLKAADEIERLRGQRPRGKWVEILNSYGDTEGWIHEECGREVICAENYCPYCGADMRRTEK